MAVRRAAAATPAAAAAAAAVAVAAAAAAAVKAILIDHLSCQPTQLVRSRLRYYT